MLTGLMQEAPLTLDRLICRMQDVTCVAEVPKTSVGKLDKKTLRLTGVPE